MRRACSLWLSLLLLLAFGLAQGPRLCLGDGMGRPCTMAACACVMACSCRAAHAEEAHRAADTCCASESACHASDAWPHFAPGDPGWSPVLGAIAPALRLAAAPSPRFDGPTCPAGPPRADRLKPPRLG